MRRVRSRGGTRDGSSKALAALKGQLTVPLQLVQARTQQLLAIGILAAQGTEAGVPIQRRCGPTAVAAEVAEPTHCATVRSCLAQHQAGPSVRTAAVQRPGLRRRGPAPGAAGCASSCRVLLVWGRRAGVRECETTNAGARARDTAPGAAGSYLSRAHLGLVERGRRLICAVEWTWTSRQRSAMEGAS